MVASISRGILLCALVSTWSPAVGAQGQVHIVGSGGFSQIQDAINAAQDGDTVLVRIPGGGSPLYDAIDVAGKSLTIVGDSSTNPVRVDGVNVHGVPVGKTVLLSRIAATSTQKQTTVRVSDNSGHLRLLACSSRGKDGVPFFNPHATYPAHTMGWQALTIAPSSGSVALASCELIGGDGSVLDAYVYASKSQGGVGGGALEMAGSSAALFDSTLTGGKGGPGLDPVDGNPGKGGAGASLFNSPSRLLVSNSALQGGRGGDVPQCPLYGSYGGKGGTGLELGASGTSAVRHATTITGGAGSVVPAGCGVGGPSGQAIVLNSGTLTVNPTAPLRLTAPALVREGDSITLDFTGTPGDKVTLFLGHGTSFREKFGGALLVSAPSVRYFLGTIGASGTLSVTSTVPSLSVGVEATNVWLQGLAIHANAQITLGNFAAVTVLDASL